MIAFGTAQKNVKIKFKFKYSKAQSNGIILFNGQRLF